ncbi:MAG: TetR/AcrR family transcriptional regulator [Coprococcus sp.]
MEGEYPQKVLAIYEAVGRLIASGKDMEKLTVSDITREAGIGKGTAYEYFGSKDEIIGKAICFQMHKTVTAVNEKLTEADTLREQLELIMKWSEKGLSSNIIYCFLKLQMNRAEGAEELQKKVDEMAAARDRFVDRTADILLQTGIREGIIEPQKDMNYGRMVMAMLLITLVETSVSRVTGGRYASLDKETLLEYTIRMMKGSLQ